MTIPADNAAWLDMFADAKPGDAVGPAGRGHSSGPHRRPRIDYLAKDYESFRALLLDRLATTIPSWMERDVPDTGIMLVELLAYAADYLSYRQDAVATEAYLSTARTRGSLRRHARLLDYAVNDGCSAAAWIQVRVSGDGVFIPRGTAFATRLERESICLPILTQSSTFRLPDETAVFEALHALRPTPACNEMSIYCWNHLDFTLNAGATRAALLDHWCDDRDGRVLDELRTGDVLVFEESIVRGTALSQIEDLPRRHAVRLTSVSRRLDSDSRDEVELQGTPIVEIEWRVADALPFALPVRGTIGHHRFSRGARVLGNIVLADHGRTSPTWQSLEMDRLGNRGMVHNVPGTLTRSLPYDDARARHQPAIAAMQRDARRAIPAVRIESAPGERWVVRSDLIGGGALARHFVVDVQSDGTLSVEFGNNVAGRQPTPGVPLLVRYRTGTGPGGNVGPSAIGHIIPTTAEEWKLFSDLIDSVWNPLPGSGGSAPETSAAVRQNAPQAFRVQERCVTQADYLTTIRAIDEVADVAVVMRTADQAAGADVYVERRNRSSSDPEFLHAVRRFIEPYRLAGHEVRVHSPHYVFVHLVLEIIVSRSAALNRVGRLLERRFGNGVLSDGNTGFFHPENFGFGTPVYRSRIVTAALEIPGVLRVRVLRFHRENVESPHTESVGALPLADEIPIGATEIARLDRQHGALEFILVDEREL